MWEHCPVPHPNTLKYATESDQKPIINLLNSKQE